MNPSHILKPLAITFVLVFSLGSTNHPAPALTAHATLNPIPTTQKPLQPIIETKVVHEVYSPPKPVSVAPVTPSAPSAPSGSCSEWITAAGIDNPSAAYFIFQHESGCNPASVNGSGCRGLGQACPGSKLPCSSSDGVCQARYFDGYAKSRYGSWSAAQSFWMSHHYW